MDGNDERRLWLSRQLSAPVSLVWTDNRSVMISVKGNAAAGYHLRIQQLFRQAPEPAWRALVAHVRGTDAGASAILRQYVRDHQHLLKPPEPTPCPCPSPAIPRAAFRPGGHLPGVEPRPLRQPGTGAHHLGPPAGAAPTPVHPLRGLQSQGAPDPHPPLAGPGVRAALRGSRTLSSTKMLHQLHPPQRINGRWSIHTPAFRRAERRFPHFERAEAWQRRHLARLLRG